MQTTNSNYGWLNYAAVLLLLPAAWFFGVNLLNEAGIHGPYDASVPLFENLGIQEKLGWNINLLIAIWPVIAFLLTVFQVVHIDCLLSKEQFQVGITIRRKWFPLSIAFVSAMVLAALCIYLVAENFVVR